MKIFISCSGSRSKYVGETLRNWLPNVIQGLEPWLFSNDIDKGTRWSLDIANQLEQTRVGIICLTQENLEAPWILFEAGALSKTINQSYVCPFLIGVEPTDIKGHLAQFQATKAEENDTKKLIHTINRALDSNNLPESRVDAAFNKWWSDLESKLNDLPEIEADIIPRRSERDMIQEVLTIARTFQRREREYSNNAKKAESQLRNLVTSLNEIVKQLKNLARR